MSGTVRMSGMLGAARTSARLEAARTPGSKLDLGWRLLGGERVGEDEDEEV